MKSKKFIFISYSSKDFDAAQNVFDYTFCEYYSENPEKFTKSDVLEWRNTKARIITEIGYEIYDRMILNNSDFKNILADT